MTHTEAIVDVAIRKQGFGKLRFQKHRVAGLCCLVKQMMRLQQHEKQPLRPYPISSDAGERVVQLCLGIKSGSLISEG